MIRSRAATIALAIHLVAVGPAVAADGVDALFAEYMGKDRPGCAVTVTQEGRVTSTRAYGQAIVEVGQPNSPETEFHVASVSKQFTAMAIRLLESEGRISLHDDVRTYVPEAPDFGSTITLGHLLNHTSGLRDQWELLTMQGRRHGDAFSQEDVMRVLTRQRELNFAPGERLAYSNSNYTLLAVVVERVSGQPFAEFMADRIFEPLGMADSYINADIRAIRPNQAWPYASGPSGYERRQLAYSNYGATDLRTTAADMAHWLIYLEEVIADGDWAGHQGGTGVDAKGREVPYAWGLFRGQHRGEQTLEHSGIDPGFAAQVMVVPRRRLGVAVMCNVETAQVQKIARQIVDLHLGVLESPSGAPTQAPEHDEAHLVSLAGLYLDEDGLPFSIVFRDGKLFAQGRDELRPIAPDQFELVSAPVSLTFDKGGALIIREGGLDRHARRHEGAPPPLLAAHELGGYVGDYYSDELGVVMRIELAGGELKFRAPGIEAPLFQPPDALRIRDMFFTPSPMGWIRFSRDSSGNITSLSASNGRVVNLSFTRIS